MIRDVSSRNDALPDVKIEGEKKKSLVDSMLVYWIVLLIISLGAATVIYLVWLKDVLV